MDAKPVATGEPEQFFAIVRRRDGRVVGLLRDLVVAAKTSVGLSGVEEHYVRGAEASVISVEAKWQPRERFSETD